MAVTTHSSLDHVYGYLHQYHFCIYYPSFMSESPLWELTTAAKIPFVEVTDRKYEGCLCLLRISAYGRHSYGPGFLIFSQISESICLLPHHMSWLLDAQIRVWHGCIMLSSYKTYCSAWKYYFYSELITTVDLFFPKYFVICWVCSKPHAGKHTNIQLGCQCCNICEKAKEVQLSLWLSQGLCCHPFLSADM